MRQREDTGKREREVVGRATGQLWPGLHRDMEYMVSVCVEWTAPNHKYQPENFPLRNRRLTT